MSGRKITYLTDVALITCIVQRGTGDTIVRAAQDAGAQGATVYYAKGGGIRERLGLLGDELLVGHGVEFFSHAPVILGVPKKNLAGLTRFETGKQG